MCVLLFLVQDGTLTSQRLIHHSVAEKQGDIYGCLMQLCVCVCVCVKETERVCEDEWKKHKERVEER